MLNAEDLVAEDDRQLTIGRLTIDDLVSNLLKGQGVVRLLDGIDRIAFGLQGFDGVEGILEIGPIDTIFCTECGLVNLGIRRAAADAAEHDALDAHGIRRAEYGPHIMLATDIIEHHNERQFVRFAVLVYAHAPHLGCR